MKAFRLSALVLSASLCLSACMVTDEDYEEAKRQRNEYSAQLQELRLANDLLNKNIQDAYTECETLRRQLAMVASVDIQKNLMAENLAAIAKARRGQQPTGSRTRR